MKIPIVDENDVQIGTKEREELAAGDYYRVSALWITNPEGNILFSQRALSKKNSPGKWGCAVAGTVEDGEDYDLNIVKEAQEEIGLSISIDKLTKGPKIFISTTEKGFFCQWYFYMSDIRIESLIVPKEEVAAVRWLPREEFLAWYKEHPEDFLSNTPKWLPQILAHSD